ncbi:MAG: hypothetical protein IJ748_05285 [Bacteroidales bacterium]|nr:hypothetical protein [Bacteroidales bacterium]
MKKALFVMGAFALATLGLTSCGSEDCVCKVTINGVQITDKATATEVDDCDDIKKFDELDTTWQTFAEEIEEAEDTYAIACEKE